MKRTMDGNEAAAYASYAFTEVAAIYPITPSSPMAEHIDEWAAQGRENIFGKPVKLVEMQSEAGAVSTMHGVLETGALASTYTASQGLLLMVPTMYRIAGQLKPGVIHVASRAVALHAYSINAEHSDVMACRQTGFAMLASTSVQDAMDLGAVAHLAAIQGSVPFLHFFDGFRTSHEIQKIDCLDYDDLAKLVDYEALERFRRGALNPEHPVVRNTGQTAETFFQSREACQEYYEPIPDIVEGYMEKINALTGRNYQLFNYYGAPDAETVVIGMGSVGGTCQETVEALVAQGRSVGYLDVHLYRPFSVRHFLSALPETVRTLIVLDRTKENGALGDPLYEDVCAAVNELPHRLRVLGGRYGLGGKDTRPEHILAVFDNACRPQPQNHFTVGIQDDVFHRSLPVGPPLDLHSERTVSCKFWGLGSDGTVGANKNTIKIIGDHTDLMIQAYFEYDGKKSGGLTRSHLRFGREPIRSAYYVTQADFVACHKQLYLHKYDVFREIKPGGAFLLNCSWTEQELEEKLPTAFKRYAYRNHIRFYIINATKIAKELGLGSRTNTILQAAFFKIVDLIPIEDAVRYMKESALKTYGKKGDAVVAMNYAAIDKGIQQLRRIEIPEAWSTSLGWEQTPPKPELPEYVRRILLPVAAQKGNDIPVSGFRAMADGVMPVGTSKYERRSIAVDVPCWEPAQCLQCNRCAYVCPNAAIRPFLLKADTSGIPKSLKYIQAKSKQLADYQFALQVDPMDCIGCGSCVNVCPMSGKALRMEPLSTQLPEMDNWDYLTALPECNPTTPDTVKASQFSKPLLEFPGCCQGCGETPYVKLVTQLFGERMCIATATGCSLVWATDYPVAPYTTNDKGRGPAMSNSLFENNGEFGYGFSLGSSTLRNYVKTHAEALVDTTADASLAAATRAWLDCFDDGNASVATSDALRDALAKASPQDPAADHISYLLKNADQLIKKSIWILGGDGWAYDIGYGGLDHVLSLGENINILVLDTEVYSNTGGQASKATQKGAVAQFASSGRKSPKKDLGMMAMAYENVYVASVAMGAQPEQYLKAVKEAEAYDGTSLIIAYAPCQSHGLKCGMGQSMAEMKRAVEHGYWLLYRYDPRRAGQGKNPLVLDSPPPSGNLRDFLDGEVRFSSLKTSFPDEAERLLSEAEQEAAARWRKYLRLASTGEAHS